MADRLAAAVVIHFNSLLAICGIPASVTRGATTITPSVVLASTDLEAITIREATISAGLQDILVRMSDYTLGEPADGDQFTYEDAGQTVIAEARPPNESQTCFNRWRGGAVFVVHCKVISRT